MAWATPSSSALAPEGIGGRIQGLFAPNPACLDPKRRPAIVRLPQEPVMRDLFNLRCEKCGRDNYVGDKNKRTMPEKFKIKKHCPACRSHQSHKEQKISKG